MDPSLISASHVTIPVTIQKLDYSIVKRSDGSEDFNCLIGDCCGLSTFRALRALNNHRRSCHNLTYIPPRKRGPASSGTSRWKPKSHEAIKRSTYKRAMNVEKRLQASRYMAKKRALERATDVLAPTCLVDEPEHVWHPFTRLIHLNIRDALGLEDFHVDGPNSLGDLLNDKSSGKILYYVEIAKEQYSNDKPFVVELDKIAKAWDMEKFNEPENALYRSEVVANLQNVMAWHSRDAKRMFLEEEVKAKVDEAMRHWEAKSERAALVAKRARYSRLLWEREFGKGTSESDVDNKDGGEVDGMDAEEIKPSSHVVIPVLEDGVFVSCEQQDAKINLEPRSGCSNVSNSRGVQYANVCWGKDSEKTTCESAHKEKNNKEMIGLDEREVKLSSLSVVPVLKDQVFIESEEQDTVKDKVEALLDIGSVLSSTLCVLVQKIEEIRALLAGTQDIDEIRLLVGALGECLQTAREIKAFGVS